MIKNPVSVHLLILSLLHFIFRCLISLEVSLSRANSNFSPACFQNAKLHALITYFHLVASQTQPTTPRTHRRLVDQVNLFC